MDVQMPRNDNEEINEIEDDDSDVTMFITDDALYDLLSLHEVCVTDTPELRYQCDCKHFLTSGIICSHVVATMHMKSDINILQGCEIILTPRRKGRSRKRKGALHVDHDASVGDQVSTTFGRGYIKSLPTYRDAYEIVLFPKDPSVDAVVEKVFLTPNKFNVVI